MMKCNEMNNKAARRNTLRRCVAMLLTMVECFSLMTVGISASYAEEIPVASPSATMTDDARYVSDSDGKKTRPRGHGKDQFVTDDDFAQELPEAGGDQAEAAGEELPDYDEAFADDVEVAGEELLDFVEETGEKPDETDGEKLPEEGEELEAILGEEIWLDDAEQDGFEGTVTVTGEGLEGVTVETRDVSGDYADFDLRLFMGEELAPMLLTEQDGAKAELGGRAIRTDYAVLTALDISLFRDGEEYQPEPEHPLAVTITDPSIREELELQLWHIRDDGMAERIESFEVAGSSLSFEADSFSVYLVLRVTVTTCITAGDGNTYRVSVTYDQDAEMPENADLAVRELDEAEKENYVNQSAETLGKDAEEFLFARAFDISLLDPDTGAELQPASGVKVSIALLDADLNEADELNLLHFGDEVEMVDYTLNDGAVEFEADGFSVYVLCGYTVDFHWGEYTYSIAGESEILLSKLLGILAAKGQGVQENGDSQGEEPTENQDNEIADDYAAAKLRELAENLADVENVVFSNSELLKVEKTEGGDWILRSLQAFDSEELLTIRLVNGEEIKIHVTDEQDHSGWNQYAISDQFTSDNTAAILYWKIESGILYIDCDAEFKESLCGTKDGENAILGGYNGQPWNSNKTSITKLVVTGQMNAIPARTLQGATNLATVDLSGMSNLKYIGPHAFYNDSKLTSITWPENIGSTFTTIYGGAFNNVKADIFPESGFNNVHFIGDKLDNAGAFQNCTAIKTIDFSGSTELTTIGTQAFSSCSNVTTINISETGLSAFDTYFSACKSKLKTLKANQCTSLAGALDLSTYTALTTLDVSGCTNLTSLTLPSGLTTLDVSGCTGLTSLTVPSGVTTLNVSGCTGLETLDVSACTGLTALNVSGCTSLTSLTLPDSVTTLNVSDCTGLTTLDVSACTGLTELDVSGCTALSSLTLPDGLTELDVSGCTSLTSLTLPDGVTTLDVSGCTGLSSLTVPNSVTALDVSDCTGLTTLDVSGCTGMTSLTVPSNVTTLDVSGCTGLDTLDLSSCTGLTAVKIGDRDDLTDLSWLTLPDSVTAVDASGFTSLTSVSVPASVTSLDISGCTGLDTLDLSVCNGLTAVKIGDRDDQTDLSWLTLPDSVTALDASGFTSLTSVSVPASVTGLNLSGCTGLGVLDLSQSSLTDIDVSNNASLTALKLPASVNALNVSGCPNLTVYFDGTTASLPANLIPDGVSAVCWGDYAYAIERNASVTLEDIFAACGITGIVTDDVESVSASDPEVLEVSGLTVTSLKAITETQTLTIALKNGFTGEIKVIKPHNVKVSITSGDYDSNTNTIEYTVTVEAENDLDYDGKEYPVKISDLTAGDTPALNFLSGRYSYAHREGFALPDGASLSAVNGTAADVTAAETAFNGFPLTVEHMYDGDTVTLSYTAEVLRAAYDAAAGQTQALNTVTITNNDADDNPNPSNNPEDDTASVSNPVPYTPLTREYVSLDGSWAYWRVTVNPKGYTLGGGGALTLKDTFDDKFGLDAGQSIDYASVKVSDPKTNVSVDSVTYDFSGYTGTFVIPDNTPVEITYRTRITAQPGEKATFRGTALLQDADQNTVASATAGVTEEAVVIYPSASDVGGFGDTYMVRLYVYGDGQMQQGIEGATFILLDAGQRPLEYKVGANKGDPVTFTTEIDSNGYVNIELHEEAGDVSIEKNTGYYLEMMQAVPGYQKDNTLYSFMITDDPSYNTGGFYKYYNGDTMKVRLYETTPGLSVSIRFSGSYALRQDQQNEVTAVLEKQDENREWVEVERHPYTDSRWGAISFAENLYDETLGAFQNIYRVRVDNESPWDLPDNIHLTTTYYCLVNTGASDPHTEPQPFSVESANDGVNVVIDNRYEEPQLTLVKMDKKTGATLKDAVFEVYKIVNGTPSGGAVITYTTDANGELVIRGGNPYESEVLYGITETAAPEDYLLPLNAQWRYFYFCNDEYLEPSILANLPEGETAINLTENGDKLTIDNQKETITVPVMTLWQGSSWPEGTEVVVGLYQSVEGSTPQAVMDESDGLSEPEARTVTLTSAMPYNNTGFTGLPSRDDQGRNITYSIKEESINGGDPLEAGYVQEYGLSSAGVYIVRNKPATTLTVSKEWYDFNGDPATAQQIAEQSYVTFDVYRSSTRFVDSNPDDGVTNADMTTFVSDPVKLREGKLVKVREGLSFSASDDWSTAIYDLDRQDDLGHRYYYYVLETVPSFGNELYEVDEENGTVTIQNKIAPETVNLTVTKAALVEDPRPESLDRDFEFTLKLKVDDSHPVRSWRVYTDTEHPENNLTTDWNGEETFTLKPTDPNNQPTEGASITLSLPVGVTATVTEAANPEYTVATAATVTGSTGDNGRTFSYETSGDAVTLTYTNTLRVVCKVVDNNGGPHPFESLKSALRYLRDNPDSVPSPWTIYLLEDYTIPATDAISIQGSESLILTTAATDATDGFPFKPGQEETDRAVITRGEVGESMLTNAGTLTLENICLDGGNITATCNGGCDGGLVSSTGTLNLNENTTLRNSTADGKGGAVYAAGVMNIVDGVLITGNSAPSASAVYLNGTLNMTGGRITDNSGAADGALTVGASGGVVNLSHSPVITGNTNAHGKAANLYIGDDSDTIVNVVAPGLDAVAHIGVTAMEGHMLIGEQFASAEYEQTQTENLKCFVNDLYGYRGKLKDGTSTNIVWDGLKITIQKEVYPVGANANDRFTITLSSPSIVLNTYIIDGTLDYSVSAAWSNRPGRIILRNVKAGDEISISPLPVSEYTIVETDSDYMPTFTLAETGSSETPQTIDDRFNAENDSTVTVTNTRRLADVNLTKTLDDRLKAADEAQSFDFTVKLIDADGTPVSGFVLAEGVTTGADGTASFTMSPTDGSAEANHDKKNFKAPVGATMTITETDDPNYQITASAKTMPAEGEAAEITDVDTEHDNIFAFTVTDDGADVTFANVRKMAEIELKKVLVNKVSKTESFTFTVTLTRAASDPAANYIMYRDESDPSKNIVTDENGQATIIFKLEENESEKAIPLTIPDGTKLVVAETQVKKLINGTEQPIYTTDYSINGGTVQKNKLTATITKVSDTDSSIVFTNTRKTYTVKVTNTVNGYSGNVVPFTYTATVTDGEENDYDANGFEDGVLTFELATGKNRTLTVPYGATLTVAETFIVGYDTTVKHGSDAAVTALKDEFTVTANVNPLAFTNSQLIGLRLVNNTSSDLTNVKVTITPNDDNIITKIFRVNSDQTDQEKINEGTNRYATLSIDSGKTAILEISHKNSVTHKQDYKIEGFGPATGYYYTINNEPSFHEYADPAVLRIYDEEAFKVIGGLRYSVQDSIVTFTEQPLVSFDVNGGTWTTEMDGYRDRNGDRKVYQKAVDTGKKVASPSPAPVYPTAEEVAFLGWTADEAFAKAAHTEGEDVSAKLYNFDAAVNVPFTLYAIWARDPSVRTVTVKNGLNEALTVSVTLTDNGTPVANYTLYEDSDPANNITTDTDGIASVTLTARESKNLRVPNGAKMVFSGGNVYSTIFADDGSVSGSFAIAAVDRDGTVSLIGGVCKITDSAGSVLYDGQGKPAVYQTLSQALTNFKATTFYTDATHTQTANPAMIKMLVDEYAIETAHSFPDLSAKSYKDITVTTAGKDDSEFPYVGSKDRATLYRSSGFTGGSLFKIEQPANITFNNIILDGKNVNVGAVNGGLIYFNKSNATLTIDSGTTMRNVAFASYTTSTTGGAIYMSNGTLNVNAGLFSNLHAYQGGAICVTGGTLNLTGSAGSTRFENCYSERQDGGAIYHSAAKDLVIDGGENKDNPGIIFTRCVAAYTNGTGDGSDGGAIFATSNYTNTVTVKGCAFIECSARTGNSASTSGYGGGAINGYKVKGLTVTACSFDACDTLCGGGAVAAMVKYTDTVANETVTIKNCSFNKCNCKGQAGAVGVYQDNNKASNSATKLSVIGSTFVNCSSGTNNGSGGAVQCYLPCMVFTNSNFTDCWAGKEGGAVNNFYGDNYTQEWSKSSLTLTNCYFIRCRAEDRYDTTALQHYGGAINTKVKTVTVTGSYFEDCVSTLREGGALHIGGQGGGSTASITGSTFKNCSAKNGGGAVLSSHETLTIENCYFYGCSSSASNGGAVYHYKNSRGDSTQKYTTIKNSTFGADPDDSESTGCSAVVNGGAIWTRANTNVTLQNLTIEGNAAGSNGGGVYLDTAVTGATITGGSIKNCQAVSGSAVYVGKTATFSGDLEVSGNTVSNAVGGAIQTVDTGTLYFEGNVKVEGNKCTADSEDHDVLMQIDGNTIINTTSVGLGSGAHIGVYVSDPNSAFANHGNHDQPFGTYHNSNAGSNFLDAFFNDRDELLYGYQGTSDLLIYWGFYVCKITDADGNTLKRLNGRDAVYQRLSQAFDEFTTVNGGTPVYIKMLVEDYAIRQEAAISNFPDEDPAVNITLTTASKSDTKYPYRGTESPVCTINRTNSDNPLFNVATSGATFQLEDITLDGRKDMTAAEGDYKLITASAGEIVVNSGSTLQYAKADSGAAITGAAVTINGEYDEENKEPTVKILNCTATGNGGAISADSLTITKITNNSAKSGEYGTVFTSCTAANGGAVCVNGSTMSISGAQFQACSSTGEGGAVFHNNTGAETTGAISNSAFVSCTAGTSGGAVSSKAGKTLTVSESAFENCSAVQNGGAVNHTGSTGTTITDTSFHACRTTGTDDDYSLGGSVYTGATAVEIVGGSFTDSTAYNHGGALYCASTADGSAAIISGVNFEYCSTNRSSGGSGGAIYSANKALTLQKRDAGADTTINGCMAWGLGYSGAVYMATGEMNIKNGTTISNCYADQGGAIYLPSGVTLNLTDSPAFNQNGYTTSNGVVIDATAGACIYLEEGSRINLKDSPKFSRNILPGPDGTDRITNGAVTDFVRQDLYMAGYASTTPYDTNAASIYIVGDLSGDTIWVWPVERPHILSNEQFAKIPAGVTVSDSSLGLFRNALADIETGCTYGEYLAGVRVGTDGENVYWDKMYLVSFKKIDNKGVGVPDAQFTLYRYQDLSTTAATDVFTLENAVAIAHSLDGSNKGKVDFTSIRIGAYFMKETRVPTSFKENDATYLVLVGTPYLSKPEYSTYPSYPLWVGDGPLNVENAETLIARHTTDAGKYFGIFPLGSDGKADVSKNLASANVGIVNIRSDFESWFMKMDGEGKALPNAAFTVYEPVLDNSGNPVINDSGYPKMKRWSRDNETYPAPVKSADGTASYKKQDGTLVEKGLVYFRELPIGTYYLVETEYPDRNGDNRRTYYVESDRVFRLDITERPGEEGKCDFTLGEWDVTDREFKPCGKDSDNKYFVVTNREAVCKLTDNSNNLLYELGGLDLDVNGEAIYHPAIYATLEEGFAAAQSHKLYNRDGVLVADENTNPALKLKALKDFTISEPVTYSSPRALTFTTAERTATAQDRYVFSTTRTSDTSRAEIKRAYDEQIPDDDSNAGALITVNGARLTLQNINLIGQKEIYNGRAIHVKNSVAGTGRLTISNNTMIQQFRHEATSDESVRGGAVLLDDETVLSVNGGSASNRSAVFQNNALINNGTGGADGGALAVGEMCTVTLRNAQFLNNMVTAFMEGQGNGGAVYMSKTLDEQDQTRLYLRNTVFQDNTASHNGGALYTAELSSLTLDNSILTGNTANQGSAIFVADTADVTVSDGTIMQNMASGKDGGAINMAGDTAVIHFSGRPYVFDNQSITEPNNHSEGKEEYQRNVVLDKKSYGIITTTGSGLAANALIGIYVTGEVNEDTEPFREYGLPGTHFGTFGGTNHRNPQVFRNDRNLALYGVRYDDPSLDPDIALDSGLIYWNGVVCKLTDEDDHLLYQNISFTVNGTTISRKAPAVYTTLQEGFDASQGELFTKEGIVYTAYSGNSLKLKMLRDVELTGSVTYKGTRKVTFTTAETQMSDEMIAAGDYFVFETTRTGEERAMITRADAFTSGSMFKAQGPELTLTKIILDGGNVSVTGTNGGIMYVDGGATLTVNEGAVLRNSLINGNGGAVYVGNKGSMNLTAGTINGNRAKTGAGIFLAWYNQTNHATLHLSGNPNFGGTGTESADGTNVAANISGPKYDASGAITNGNYLTATLTNKTNGQKAYATTRQDIYLQGLSANKETALNSLVLTGALKDPEDDDKDMPAGSIWVWAESDKGSDEHNHHQMLKQFAVLHGDLISGTGAAAKVVFDSAKDDDWNAKRLESAMKAFRNARPDTDTKCGGDYLTGQKGDDLKNTKCIYWTGGFDVVFRKISGDGAALDGATFTLYKANAAGTAIMEDTNVTTSDKRVAYQVIGAGGTKVDATAASAEIASADAVAIKVNTGTAAAPVIVEKAVYGSGLAVFEKIPPGTYFIKEEVRTLSEGQYVTSTGAPVITGTALRYEPAETMYKLVLDGAGWFAIYAPSKDAGGNDVWTGTLKEAPITSFKDDGTVNTGTKKYAADGNGTDTLAVYNLMNVDPRGHKLILRKIDNAYTSLFGARFRLFRADLTEITDGQPSGKTYYESGINGVFFIGTLPVGKYYLLETGTPTTPTGYGGNAGKVFVLTVTKDGYEQKELGKVTSDGTLLTDDSGNVKQFSASTEESMVTAFKNWMMENP